MNIRLMSFNTQHCLNYFTRQIDFGAFAKTIKDLGADIVGLQEIRGEGAMRGEYEAQTEELASLTGFNYYFAEAIRFGGENPYGNALLSRYPIIKAETVIIPDPDPKKYNGYYETRCVLKTLIDVPGCEPLTVLVSHFGLNPDEQENAANTVNSLIEDRRCVFMGDLNVRPDNAVLAPIRRRMTDTADSFPDWDNGLTFPSDKPRMMIDYIFVSRDIKVSSAQIPAAVISDHRPYLADVIIKD